MEVGSYSARSSSDNDSWDLNLDPSDGEEEVSHHLAELEVRKKAVNLPAMEVMQNLDDGEDCMPRVGMVFESEEQAYSFYNAYARRLGFSVRKGELKRLKSGRIYLREFLCSRQGYRAKHTRGPPKKPRPQTRTKCRACIRFKVKEDGCWVVRKFIEEHNHNFASQSEVHLLRSQRSCLTMCNGSVSFTRPSKSGIAQATSDANVDLGGSQHLNFKHNDPNNCYQRRRREIYGEGDAQVALNYFRLMQKESPGFSYAVQLEQQNQICNFFWADAKSKIDYSYFGDVVCFDTTFQTNKENMPCAPIVGVNHHGMTVIFGCALLVDETTESFIWLFESFLNAMSGKRPKTILTDQSQAIADAIAKVMPDTHRRLCLWHIYQNAAKHFAHVMKVTGSLRRILKDAFTMLKQKRNFSQIGSLCLTDMTCPTMNG
ncbi:hypothetical protein Scep_012734 [Stephania cephalantha]|uniref:Protein FAR1-RELATED SEQUENCE n=1 Tax=Stephania cephalantha TaxID=152367 RepID=A0AAP0JFI1_9MAGN